MKIKHSLILIFFAWGFVMNTGCSSQTKDKSLPYPTCEPHSTTDPGRLNIRASAENFGMISPCSGKIEIYINSNSRPRSLVVDFEYRKADNEAVHQEQIRAELEQSSTGIFQTEIAINPIEGKSCRSLQIAIGSITCYSVDGDVINCPQIRIIPPDAFELLIITDETQTICMAD